MTKANTSNPKTLEVIILNPRGTTENRVVKTFTEIQAIVGGYVEMFVVDGTTYLCNEECGYDGTKEINVHMYNIGQYIRGPVVKPLGDIDSISYE